MNAKITNSSGVKIPVNGLGTILAHGVEQIFSDRPQGDFTESRGEMGVNAQLKRLADFGDLTYKYALEATDVSQGLVGDLSLDVSFAAGDFTEAATSQDFAGVVEFPTGAMFLAAFLDVGETLEGSDVSAAEVAAGYTGATSAFDADADVLSAAARLPLTDLTVGTDLGGKSLTLSVTTTDDDVSNLTQGILRLVVIYSVLPVT